MGDILNLLEILKNNWEIITGYTSLILWAGYTWSQFQQLKKKVEEPHKCTSFHELKKLEDEMERIEESLESYDKRIDEVEDTHTAIKVELSSIKATATKTEAMVSDIYREVIKNHLAKD